ncbi:MAG: hypothetical protein AAF492_21530, partial [Verrucomicrobiota bacterium]
EPMDAQIEKAIEEQPAAPAEAAAPPSPEPPPRAEEPAQPPEDATMDLSGMHNDFTPLEQLEPEATNDLTGPHKEPVDDQDLVKVSPLDPPENPKLGDHLGKLILDPPDDLVRHEPQPKKGFMQKLKDKFKG